MKIEEVLQIKEQMMGDYSVQAVDSRELALALGSKRKKHRDWCLDMVDQCDLKEGVDFVKELSPVPTGGRPEVYYVFTLDAAKYITLLFRGESSKQVMRYFLECEKQVQQNTQALIASNAQSSNLQLELENRVNYNLRILNLAFANVSDGIRVANILEVKTQLEQETGIEITLPNQLQRFIVESDKVEFDASVDTAFASRFKIGSTALNVTGWAKMSEDLYGSKISSTDINKILIELGYLTRLNGGQFAITKKGSEFGNDVPIAGSVIGLEGRKKITGWNLDDKRFTDIVHPAISKFLKARETAKLKKIKEKYHAPSKKVN